MGVGGCGCVCEEYELCRAHTMYDTYVQCNTHTKTMWTKESHKPKQFCDHIPMVAPQVSHAVVLLGMHCSVLVGICIVTHKPMLLLLLFQATGKTPAYTVGVLWVGGCVYDM